MPVPKGTIEVEILPDGTVKAETGDMGGATHKQADDFLALVQKMLGGPVEETKARQGHHHFHAHDHGSDHQHH